MQNVATVSYKEADRQRLARRSRCVCMCESDMLVEAVCEWVLLVDRHFVYVMVLNTIEEEHFAQTLIAPLGCKKEHLKFMVIDSHESDRAVVILSDDKMIYFGKCRRNIRLDTVYLGWR